MLVIDWSRFGYAVREKLTNLRRTKVEQMLGVSHTAFHRAVHGKPVGIEIYLTICEWLQEHPMHFVNWREALFRKTDDPSCAEAKSP